MLRRLIRSGLFGLLLSGAMAEEPKPVPAPIARTVVVLGDSLSAGYGVDPSESWPSVVQGWVARLHPGWTVVNAGVSGDTTAGGLRRLDWILRRPVGILVLELGGNDGLRGIPVESTKSNLLQVIDRTRVRWPEARIVVAGMKMPPNFGAEFTRRFEAVFPEVARERDVVLIPFLLEGVGGEPSLNQADQIHPNPEGHRRVATNVWNVLGPLLDGLGRTSSTTERAGTKAGLPSPKPNP